MTSSTRSKGAIRRMLRWGSGFFAVHSAILILIAPSAFLYYGEGFILSRNQAFIAHRLLDGAVVNVVYDIANYRIPHEVHWWLAEHFSSLDELSLFSQTILYLVVGGAFYFIIGACLGAVVSAGSALQDPGTSRETSARGTTEIE